MQSVILRCEPPSASLEGWATNKAVVTDGIKWKGAADWKGST